MSSVSTAALTDQCLNVTSRQIAPGMNTPLPDEQLFDLLVDNDVAGAKFFGQQAKFVWSKANISSAGSEDLAWPSWLRV